MSVGTLVDSNVILDVMTEDPQWCDWSLDALAVAGESGPLYINQVIFGEVSVRFSTIEALDMALPADDFRRVSLPWTAAFLAAKAFAAYRRRGGSKTTTLPDFLIGAHAAIDDLTLLTRDVGRYRAYFPTVELFAP